VNVKDFLQTAMAVDGTAASSKYTTSFVQLKNRHKPHPEYAPFLKAAANSTIAAAFQHLPRRHD
jgi:hypothetical protein